MGEVELPLLNSDATVDEAFDALKRHGSSALVVADGPRHSLVFGGALLIARDEHVQNLRDVQKHPLNDERNDTGDEFVEGLVENARIIGSMTLAPGIDAGGFSSSSHYESSEALAAGQQSRRGPRDYSLRTVFTATASVVTAHEWLATGLARPDLFRCDIIRRHTYPDPPDVNVGDQCRKCIKDPALTAIGTIRLVR